MANLFKNPGKWLNDAGKSAARDWKNAGRGEVGRWASGVGQSAYNIVAAPVRAVESGNYSRELQRIGGSALNLASAGTFDYAGRSSGVQKFLNSDPIIGRNIGALTHGTSTTSRQGVLSNRDRNYIWQGVVKGAAVTGAVYGGTALYGYLSAPSEAAAVGTGDFFASAGPGAVPGVLSAPAYGSSGAAATASIGTSSLAATSSGAAAAAGSSGIWSTLSKTAETLGITTAVSKLVGNQIAGSPQGTSSEIVPLPMFGGPSGAPGAPIVFNVPSGGGGGFENFSAGPDLNKVAIYGAIAVGALVLMRVAKVV